MHFSEDELRTALRRKDPGESFTKEVMTRVTLQQARVLRTPSLIERLLEFCRAMAFRPALAGVIALVLILAGSFGFLQYRHIQEQRAGELAKQRALLALRITSSKLNHVLEHVRTTQAP